MILTVCGYVRNNDKTLLLYRNKKKNDINEGKYIGIGGKLEKGETPERALIRECKEEADILIKEFVFKGMVTYPNIVNNEDEIVYFYEIFDYDGDVSLNCKEGKLQWINNDEIGKLNLWEGDRYILGDWFKREEVFSGLIRYLDDKVVEKEVHFYKKK